MSIDLQFKGLPVTRNDVIQLVGVTRIVQAITARNLEKATQGAQSPQFVNRKEQMKRRLMERSEAETFEHATDEVGREMILLSLYLEYTARSEASWLPAFDGSIVDSVLGTNGNKWHAGRRRDATQLFFTHFDRLPPSGLSRLCLLIVGAYASVESLSSSPVAKWRYHREVLFTPIGHQGVARSAASNETLPLLMERFAIPSDGRFAECLRQVFLLNAVRDCPLGQEIPALAEIEALKTERASVSQLMGAAALQIMVQRVTMEGGRKWNGDWPNWITRLGCDPRHGRATAEGSKWWGWATDEELRLAQQGITGLTLRFFIEFLRRSLQGTEKEPQFALRSRFLLNLYEAGKIESARLALNWATYEHLDRKYRDVWSVSHLSQTTDDTSMICLKCMDNIFIIEGTHSFGLRMFHKNFPIPSFWERPKQAYQDRELRISPSKCPVFLRHDHGGNWVNGFFHQLRSQFHVEWGDVSLKKTSSSSHFSVPKKRPQVSIFPVLTPASQPSKLRGDSNSLNINNYAKYLKDYLISIGRPSTFDPRIKNFHALERAGIIENLLILEVSNDRVILVIKCIDGVTLIDAVHYDGLRGVRDQNQLWNSLRAADCGLARQAQIIMNSHYPLRISHAPLESCLNRLIKGLSDTWKVGWTIKTS